MAKGMVYTLSAKEVEEFLGLKGRQPYKMRGHSFTSMGSIGKQVCKNCGLVALNNKATEWCIDRGCNYEDAKGYESAMKRFTKMK